MRNGGFERSVTVVSSPERVWAGVTTPAGIVHEMRPWLAMSVPRGAAGVTIDDVEVGRPLGRAWLRLFGLLPFDYDDLVIVDLEPGRRFREESRMLSMRRWEHERTVAPAEAGGATLTDRVAFTPRWPLAWAAPLLTKVVSAFFAHRHRRLAAWCAAARPSDT